MTNGKKNQKEDLHVNPIGNSLWRAGAGAGKTYNLVERVLRLAEEWSTSHEGRFPRVIVTTFTRMATQELRVRLMEAALDAREKKGRDFIPFVTSRSQLFVTTLHGVMDSFLRSFGSEIGLEPGFRVGGAEEIESLVRRVGNRVLFAKSSFDSERKSQAVDELMNEFDFATTLRLLQRVQRLRVEFADTEQSVRSAGVEDFLQSMATSLQSLREPLEQLKFELDGFSTFEKWTPYRDWLGDVITALKKADGGNAVPAQLEDLRMWLDSAPKVINGGKQKIFETGDDWKKPVKDLAKMIDDLEVELPALERFAAINEALSTVEEEFSKALREEKFRSGLIELEDLELLALEVVRKSPTAAATFAEGWDHWLIDEYQDTSPRQVLLVKALAGARPVFVVGDPQQSIYMFRGARPHVFFDRETEALKAGHEIVQLQGNRRSHPEVMTFINLSVTRLGPEFQAMTAARTEMNDSGRRSESVPSPFGAATFLALDASAEVDENGSSDKLSASERRKREVEHLARAAARILSGGASPASVAVLAKSNNDLVIVAREFIRQGLPIQIHTAGAYSDRLEVSDLCALLGFLANPHDDENLIQLARAPWFPVDEDILALGYQRKSSLWAVIEGSVPATLREGLETASKSGVVAAFRELLVRSDFFSWCGVLDPSGRREANALKFVSKLSVAERQAGFVARRFVDEVLGGSDRGGENESSDRDAIAAAKPDRIHLMTIHVSKGLEFDHVFLPFLAEPARRGRSSGEFVYHEQKRIWTVGLSIDDETPASAGPLAREWSSILSDWSLDEQKRLLYVALTRARESLFLSATGEAAPKSFLSFLNLSRQEGGHEIYQTLRAVDALESPSVLRESLSRSGFLLRASWSPESSSANANTTTPTSRSDLLVPISVTQMVEEESAKQKSALSMTTDMKSQKIKVSSQKALSMAVAAARGTRLHRVFELAKSESNETMAREISRWFVGDEIESAKTALRWLLALREPELAMILENGSPEWSFTFVEHGFAIDGQIDLWGRDSTGRLWIVDYKTGTSDYKDKAFLQLKIYARALIAGGFASREEKIFLAALFPFSQEVFVESTAPVATASATSI